MGFWDGMQRAISEWNTIAVATVEAGNLRPVGKRDVNHVRELQPA
jgi:hypothetical protein